jgi:hypothetical protein
MVLHPSNRSRRRKSGNNSPFPPPSGDQFGRSTWVVLKNTRASNLKCGMCRGMQGHALEGETTVLFHIRRTLHSTPSSVVVSRWRGVCVSG